MKKLALYGAVLAALLSNPAWSRDYVIALPEALDREKAEQVWKLVTELTMDQMEPGESLTVYNATGLRLIADFTIPESNSMKNKNRRRRALSGAVNDFGAFIKEHYLQGDTADTTAHHVHLPQSLAEISSQRFGSIQGTEREVCILVVGDALYLDDREPSFDMRNGYFPSDGHIVASQTRSVYGTADKQGQLKGMNIHFLYTNEDWLSDVYQLRVQRTWFLFIAAQGGMLASFTPDFGTAVPRFRTCTGKPGRKFTWDSSRNEIAMINVTRIVVPEDEIIEQEVNEGESTIAVTDIIANEDWLRSDEVALASEAPSQDTGALKLGIRWGDTDRCATSDVDLYVRSSPSRPYLYYSNKSSPDGMYHKDFTSAPDARNGLEYVDITDEIPLRDLDIKINHYSGECSSGVQGVVRAYFNGAAYELPFQMEATRGNQGQDRNRAEQSNYWVVVNPEELFRLSSVGQ